MVMTAGVPYSTVKPDSSISWIKYLLFAFNLVIFLIACALLGVTIWMAVDRNFMTKIIGNELYAVALFFLMAGGAIIFIVAFLGCCGAVVENRLMIMIYFGTLVFIAVLFFVGAILAIVFRTQIGDSVKDSMADTLKNHYGVDFHEDYNRAITWGWDQTQEKLYCCGVEDEGWGLYYETKWFERYGDTNVQDGRKQGHEDQRPYVPQSCCIMDRFRRYVNLEVCQKWRLGPPGASNGAINRALYYQGCYNALWEFLMEYSAALLGLGICLAVVLVAGIVLSFLLLRHIPKG